jgi:DNA-binding NarL/FixJ family response regulator
MTPTTALSLDMRPTMVLASDSPAVVEAASSILQSAYNIIQVAVTGPDALSQILGLRPNLAIVDICMPELDGIAVARKLCRAGCNTRIVLLTQIEDEDYITEARAIAYGYVFKRRLHTDLPLAVASAISGAFFLSH